MAPPFIFRIDEFTEHPDAPEQCDTEGKWIPLTLAGYNYRTHAGVSNNWWLCNRQRIQHLPNWSPKDTAPYKVFSTFYSGGHGFWILRGDATNPLPSETWHHLWFDHDETNFSSSLTNAGSKRTLRCQRPDAWWPHMLLPCIYHGPAYQHEGYGGLTGDLPIFLSLLALSMEPDKLSQELPRIMQNGDWATHNRPHGRTDKRGVIVYVYAVEGNDAELGAYEDGRLGKYYN